MKNKKPAVPGRLINNSIKENKMLDSYRITVISECPYDKLSQKLMTIQYFYSSKGNPIGYNAVCQKHHEGSTVCHKCIFYFTKYITRHGVPQDHEIITPDLSIVIEK